MRRYLCIALFVLGVPVFAESTLVTIQLHHRSANEVINTLRPMLDPGASISGSGYKLFIRSSEQNIEQLRNMLAQIDVASRNLLVSVTMNPEVVRQDTRIEAHVSVQGKSRVEIGGQDGVHAQSSPPAKGRIMYDARLFNREQHQQQQQVHQVRVTEGLWATIQTGEAIPVTTRTRNADGTVTDTFSYQPVSSGFKVLPRVHGDTVTLTIRPQSQSKIQGTNGAYSTTEMETSVSGKLGSWIPLGSVAQSEHLSGTGIAYGNREISNSSNQIYVKVNLAKP